MSPVLRRSILLAPADRSGEVAEKALWGADALCLDLEGLVHPKRRPQARQELRQEVAQASRSGTQVLVRLSLAEAEADLKACLGPGLAGVMVSGLTSAEDVGQIDGLLASLEGERGLPQGSVGLLAFLDTGKGLWFAPEIASASRRMEALILGLGDLALDMLKVSEEVPYFTGPVPRFPVQEYVWSRLATVAAAYRLSLLGLMGTTIAPGFVSKDSLASAARLACLAGFKGAITLHREGVEACNIGFAKAGAGGRKRGARKGS